MIFLATLLLSLVAPLFAETSIAQVDPSSLLTRQRVDIYVGVSDGTGGFISGLGGEDFALFEGVSPDTLVQIENFELTEGINAADGIIFHIVVDNSGSMYDRIDGMATSIPSQTRMAAVGRAVSSFLNAVDNPKDLIGLASFNTNYDTGLLPGAVRSDVEAAFARITRPEREEAYTELYASLTETAAALSGRKGRKVVILLSDGENYPYSLYEKRPHPLYGDRITTSDEAIEALIGQGVSVFPVHFGPARRDASLRRIASATGGKVFDAQSEGELAAAYAEIRNLVLREYRLRYRPAMMSGDKRTVRVEYRNPGSSSSATQYYFTGTLFASDSSAFGPLLLIPLLLALALWFALTRFKLLNKRPDANLEVLDGGLTKVFSLSDGRTIIGQAGGELTIAAAGAAPARAGDVTVFKEPASGAYTLVSSKPVYVNNRATTNRKLSPGDVIRMGEATIVFDEPVTSATTAGTSPKAR